MEMNLLKKNAFVVSCFDNKKTNTLELYKNTMKNYVWETSSLKAIDNYSRFNVFNLSVNKFLIFNSSKDESSFTLNLTEL